MTKILFLVYLFIFSSGFLFAQNAKLILESGHAAYLKGNFDRALDYYDQVLLQDRSNFDALLFSGIIFYSRKNYSKAIEFLNKINVNAPNSTLLFYQAECFFFLEDYDQALVSYNTFLKLSHPDYELVQRALEQKRHAEFAAQVIRLPLPASRSVNWLNKIASDADDHNPWLAEGDRVLYFTSDRHLDRDYDIYKSIWNGSSFDAPERLPEPINSTNHEGEFSVTSDQKTIVISTSTWCPPQTNCKSSYKSKISFASGERWSVPKLLSENIYFYVDIEPETKQKRLVYDESLANPALTSDGKSLYFSSNRPGGMGGFDLWASYQSDTGWTKPVNLGPSINTPGNEADPCLMPDGTTLFFSSTGHPGFGGYDFFVSVLKSDTWSTPVNLGRPFNTSGDEFDLFVSAGSTRFWFNREVPSKRNGNRQIRQLQVVVLEQPLEFK